MPTASRLTKAAVAIVAAAAVGWGCWWLYDRYGGERVEPSRELYPVRGADLSAHNGEPDFRRMRADGIGFVILKATEGTDFRDRAFRRNHRYAREAGMKVGAYHFFRFDTDGELQAINFLHATRGRHLDLPLAIDIEEWGNPDGQETAMIVSQLRAMISYLEAEGQRVMLYTNKDGYDRFVRGNFDSYPLWICSFSDPPLVQPAAPWLFWQYSHRGSVDGVGGHVDLNTFAGDSIAWEAQVNLE